MAETVLGIKISVDGAQAITGVNSVKDGLKGLGDQADKTTAQSEGLTAAIAKIGHYTSAYFLSGIVIDYTKSLVEARVALDSFNAKMNIATGSAAQTAVEYEHIRALSNRLGTELRVTADAYASFSAAAIGTTMAGKGARDVFDAVANVSAKMHLSTEKSQGVFYALSQMMSKGVVSAEEFRQQLGEHLPIATSAGAKALGLTTEEFTKMLNSGKILSEDFLPKFARTLNEMAGGNGPIDNMQASINRLSNKLLEQKQSFNTDFIKSAIDGLTNHFDLLAQASGALLVSAGAFATLKAGSGVLQYVSALTAQKAASLAAAEASATQTAANMALARSQLAATASATQQAIAQTGANSATTLAAREAAAAAAANYTKAVSENAGAAASLAAASANATLAGSMRALLLANPFTAIAAGVGVVYIAVTGLISKFDEATTGFENFLKKTKSAGADEVIKERQVLIAEVAAMKNSSFSGFYEADIRRSEDKIRIMDARLAQLKAQENAVSSAPVGKQSAVDAFVTDDKNLSAAQIKQKALNDELVKFADAVKGFDQQSAQYLAARRALDQGIANINAKDKKPQDAKSAVEKMDDAEIKRLQELTRAASGQLAVQTLQAQSTDKLTESERKLAAFQAENLPTKNQAVLAARAAYEAKLNELIVGEKAAVAATAAQNDPVATAEAALHKMNTALKLSQDLSKGLAGAVGASVGKLFETYATGNQRVAEIEKNRAKEIAAANSDQVAIEKIKADASYQTTQAQLDQYAGVAGAAKTFFDQGSL